MNAIINKQDFTSAIEKINLIRKHDELVQFKILNKNTLAISVATHISSMKIEVFINIGNNDDNDECIINDKAFSTIYKNLKYMDDKITITNSDEFLFVTDAKMKQVKLTIKPLDSKLKLPATPIIKNIYRAQTVDFIKRIALISYAMSKDDIRVALNGIHFNGNDLVAIDGFRLAIDTNTTSFDVLEPFTIQKNDIKVLTKLIDNKNNLDMTMSISNTDITYDFKNKQIKIRYASDLIEGKYFKYHEVLKKSPNSFTVNKNELYDNLRFLTASLPSKPVSTVTFKTINENKEFSMKCSNLNASILNINKNEVMNFSMNSCYLMDMISHINKETIDMTFNYQSNINPFICIDGTTTHLILPVRLKDEDR